MKTLFVAYRVTDLDRSLDYYTALGYVELGRVALDDGGRLAILKFPEEPVATLELVHRPGSGRVEVGGGFDHLAIQVDALAATLERLTEAGLSRNPCGTRAVPKARRRRGSPTRTVTGSSWFSGRPDIPTASPKQTSPEATTVGWVTKLSRSNKRV